MFAEYLRTDEIIFKYAKGCRDVYGKEFHVFHEIFLLIGDTANFISDNIVDKIGENSVVIIPKGHFHQFDHIGEEEDYHRYVIQFTNIEGLEETVFEVFDSVKIFHNVKLETIMLFQKLAKLINEDKKAEDKECLLRAIFTEILFDLKYSYTNRTMTERHTDTTVLEIIEYINSNFLQNITIKNIADYLNFSETYISHKFKEVMHISVYKYILQKKMMYAHSLITFGVLPTQAATCCGFDNYSGFYKIYKRYFGFSPSKTVKRF